MVCIVAPVQGYQWNSLEMNEGGITKIRKISTIIPDESNFRFGLFYFHPHIEYGQDFKLRCMPSLPGLSQPFTLAITVNPRFVIGAALLSFIAPKAHFENLSMVARKISYTPVGI
mgnify:CR=1 FL=1